MQEMMTLPPPPEMPRRHCGAALVPKLENKSYHVFLVVLLQGALQQGCRNELTLASLHSFLCHGARIVRKVYLLALTYASAQGHLS